MTEPLFGTTNADREGAPIVDTDSPNNVPTLIEPVSVMLRPSLETALTSTGSGSPVPIRRIPAEMP